MNTTIKSDSHTHSIYSSDARSTIEENCLIAKNIGLDYLAITDHIDIDYPGNEIFNSIDIKKYRNEIIKMREKYSDSFYLALGIEIGIQPHLHTEISQIIKKLDPDFIIGSTHCVNRKEISSDGLFFNKTKEQAYNEYFEAVFENIQITDNYDSVGHLDFVARYYPNEKLPIVYSEYASIIDEILSFIIKSDKSLEINSSGFRYGLSAPHPTPDILKRYKELGGQLITIGSDAHRSSDITSEYNLIYEILTIIGFKYHFTYKNRKPIAHIF